MRSNIVIRNTVVVLILVCISLGGCVKTPPIHLYLLKPVVSLDPPSPAQGEKKGAFIVIGPVTVPDYLERPYIVTRSGENQLYIDVFHQWAEPLDRNFVRVLGENLSKELVTERIAYFPTRKSSPADYRIFVGIIRFEANEDGETVLIARWRVLKGKSEEVVIQKRSRFSETASQLTYDAISAAMSRNLGKLSMEIASIIKADR